MSRYEFGRGDLPGVTTVHVAGPFDHVSGPNGCPLACVACGQRISASDYFSVGPDGDARHEIPPVPVRRPWWRRVLRRP